jgi:hypothetical protein
MGDTETTSRVVPHALLLALNFGSALVNDEILGKQIETVLCAPYRSLDGIPKDWRAPLWRKRHLRNSLGG